MTEVMSDGQVLKQLILSKAARGKYINARRTIRDLEMCEDLDQSDVGKDNDMQVIKAYMAANVRAKVANHNDVDTLKALGDSLKDLSDRLDKAGF